MKLTLEEKLSYQEGSPPISFSTIIKTHQRLKILSFETICKLFQTSCQVVRFHDRKLDSIIRALELEYCQEFDLKFDGNYGSMQGKYWTLLSKKRYFHL